MSSEQVLVVTSPTLPGYEILRVVGPVYGITVRSRGVGGRFVAGIQTLAGGEITAYTSECEKARAESLQRMMDKAREVGANAVVSADFETSDILQGIATIFAAYGTAVVVKPIGQAPRVENLCPNCKAPIPVGSSFCQSCGTKL
ncbi:heavy metal-binding domain-containing protein [bacterium]|nr:MAG: heavy metal-binding domain-containing protein [bacterium]